MWTAADEAFFSSLLHESPAASLCQSLSPPAGADLNTPPHATLSAWSALPPALTTESPVSAPTTVSCVVAKEVSKPAAKKAPEPTEKEYHPELPPRWLTEDTRYKVAEAISGRYRDTCKYCDLRAPTRRLRVHVRQHFIRCFCPCGFNRVSRHSVGDHQRRNGRSSLHGGTDGKIYEVDKESYPAFCTAIDWEDPEPFQECVPNLQPKDQPAEPRVKRRRPSPPPSAPPSASPRKRARPPPSDAGP